LLARIYEIDGNWPKARELFEALFTREGGQNPAFLAHFIRSLLRHEDAAGAAAWLGRLEAVEKEMKTPLTVELKARLLAKQGRKADAAGLLKEFARDGWKANPVVLRNVGFLLAELSIDDAEELLKQYATADAKNPHAVFALAQYLARRERVGEALAICGAAGGAVGPEAVAVYTVGMIRVGRAKGDDLARAEQIIQDALRRKPESLDIQVSLADLRDAQGRYDDAKQIYRAVIGRNPRHQMALNNLAWLLALHEGNGQEALKLIDTAIDAAGPVPNLLDTRGVVRLAAGQGEQAVGDLSEAVAQAPVATHYYHLAQAHHLAGRNQEAQRALRQAQEQGLKKEDLHALEWARYDGFTRELGVQ
jgi:tetratricopeptide (TPR) repeat protein